MITDKGEKISGTGSEISGDIEKNVGFRPGWRKRETSDLFDEQFRNSSADTCAMSGLWRKIRILYWR